MNEPFIQLWQVRQARKIREQGMKLDDESFCGQTDAENACAFFDAVLGWPDFLESLPGAAGPGSNPNDYDEWILLQLMAVIVVEDYASSPEGIVDLVAQRMGAS